MKLIIFSTLSIMPLNFLQQYPYFHQLKIVLLFPPHFSNLIINLLSSPAHCPKQAFIIINSCLQMWMLVAVGS